MTWECHYKEEIMEKKFLLNEENIKPLIKIKGSCIASDKITTMGKKI